MFKPFSSLRAFTVSLLLAFIASGRAQDATLFFNTANTGTTNSIATWGVGIVGGGGVIQSGLIYMGSNLVGVVEIPFSMKDPLTNGQLSAAVRSELDGSFAVANLAGTNKPWLFNSGTGDGVNSYFITGANRIDTNRWAQCIIASQLYANRPVQWVSPFNEPDYGPWTQGSQADLYGVMGALKNSTNFASSLMGGGTVLNADVAVSWYDAVKSRAAIGMTHTLGGSYGSYVNWLADVNASGGLAVNPEVHNLAEVIVGAQYNLKGAIWWLSCSPTRGLFATASSSGKRLAYAEVPNNWSAAAVYRPTNNNYTAYGFMASNERQGVATTYKFTALDRDVWFDGIGPARSHTTTVGVNGEDSMIITWGPDIPPPVNGTYILVNRNSGKVMEVANASLANAAAVVQNTYNTGANQIWTITSLGGLYCTLANANSGQLADMLNFSTADGGPVIQYPGGGNFAEQWSFEYLSNGWFNVRQANSGKYLEVPGSSLNDGVQLDQAPLTGGFNQQWQLVPAGNHPFNLTAPAPPTGLLASAAKVSVKLSWAPNTESDFATYTLFRSTNSGGPYDTIAQGSEFTTFIDRSANQPHPYYYVLKAVDYSQNKSAYSTEATATPAGGPALVAKYPFDGNPSDSSGNGNHGIIIGNAFYGVGKTGLDINLDGVSGYVSMPAGMLGFAHFTVAAWVNWNGGSAWQRIMDFGNGTGQYMFLTPNSGAGTLRFAITTNGPGAEQIVETSRLPSNQWVHVAVTFNGSSTSLYTNGFPVATVGMNLSPASFNPTLNYLGKSQFPADPLFGGGLDEVFLANYALSASQVASLATNHAPQFTNNTIVRSSATAAQFYSDTISGSAIDPDAGDPLTYGKSSGPAWLSVGANGAISGTPGLTDSGTNSFFVNVSDTGGSVVLANLIIYVAGVPNPVVTLTNSDVSATSSFNTTGNWNSGAAPTIPSDYFTSNYFLRTPSGTNDYIFGGNSLTLQPNAPGSNSLLFAGTGTRIYTVTNLMGDGGSIGSGSTAADTCVLAGTLVLLPGTTTTVQASQSPFVINSSISGGGSLATEGPLATALTGSNNYSGSTLVKSGTLKMNAGPVVYISFDNVNGTTVLNEGSGGNSMNGTRAGGASIVSGGRYGNALSLNGAPGSYVSIANKVTSLDCTTAGAAWTYALWLKTTTAGAKFGYQGNGGWNSAAQTSFYLNGNNPYFSGGKVGGVRFADGWLTGSTPVNDDAWHFIAITVSSGIETIYVDGDVDQQTGTTGWNAAGSAGATQFWIGGSPDTGDASAPLNGLIDEVYIYNRALSQAEIQNLTTITNAVAAGLSRSLSPASAVIVSAGAIVDLNGSAQSISSLSGNGTVTNTSGRFSTLTVSNNSGTATFSGRIADTSAGNALSFVQSGDATTILSGANTYHGTTLVNGGTLLVNGSIGSGAVTVTNGTFGGNGTIGGAVTVLSGGVLAPGGSIGPITVNNIVTLLSGSTTVMEIRKTPPANDMLIVSGPLTFGGTLVVTNVSGTLAAGDSFQLFQAGSITGSFASSSLPALGAGLAWNTSNLSNGLISVVQTTPTNLVWCLSGSNISFSWPSGYLGYRLESNAVGIAATGSWFTVTGSAYTNQIFIPLNQSRMNVFFRLAYP